MDRVVLTGARLALGVCAVLTACAIVSFPRSPLAWIAGVLSGCGALIEVIQALPFVHRDADVKDWAADTLAVGAVIGVVVLARMRRILAGGQAGAGDPG